MLTTTNSERIPQKSVQRTHIRDNHQRKTTYSSVDSNHLLPVRTSIKGGRNDSSQLLNSKQSTALNSSISQHNYNNKQLEDQNNQPKKDSEVKNNGFQKLLSVFTLETCCTWIPEGGVKLMDCQDLVDKNNTNPNFINVNDEGNNDNNEDNNNVAVRRVWVPNSEHQMPIHRLDEFFSSPNDSIRGNQNPSTKQTSLDEMVVDFIMHPGCFYSNAVKMILIALKVVHYNHKVKFFNSMGIFTLKQCIMNYSKQITDNKAIFPYYKLPIMFINKCYQLNDSLIMVLQMARLITGYNLTARELDALQYINRIVIPNLIIVTYTDPEETALYLDHNFNVRKGSKGFIRNITLPNLGKKTLKEQKSFLGTDHVKDDVESRLLAMQKALTNRLQGSKFFSGMNTPGCVDYYLIGCLYVSIRSKCKSARRLLNGSRLGGWYNATRQSLPENLLPTFASGN